MSLASQALALATRLGQEIKADRVRLSALESGGASGADYTLTSEYASTTPAAPSTGVKMFARHRARRMPAFIGPLGQDSQLQPAFFSNRMAMWQAINASTSVSTWGMAAPTEVGTASAVTGSSSNFYQSMTRKRYTTAATLGASAGFRTSAQWFTSGVANAGGFFFVCRFGLQGVMTNTRGFIGLSTTTGALAGGTNPSALLNQIGFGWDAGQTTLQFMRNDGTGTSTMVDLGANFPVTSSGATYFYEVRLFAPSGAGNQVYYSAHRLNDGAIVQGGPITTDLPAVGALLAAHVNYSNGTNLAAATLDVQNLYIETDN